MLNFEHNSTYLFKIDSVREIESQKKKTPGIQVSMISIAGSTKGKKFTDTLWRTKGTKWMIDSFLNATEVSVIPSDTISLYETFNGKQVEVRMSVEEGNTDATTKIKYEDRNRIGKFMGPVTGTATNVIVEDEEAVTDVPF